jgi:hypothetical protein
MVLLSPELASLRVSEPGCSPPGLLLRSDSLIDVTPPRFLNAALPAKVPKSWCQFVDRKMASAMSWTVMLRPSWGLE